MLVVIKFCTLCHKTVRMEGKLVDGKMSFSHDDCKEKRR